MKISRLAIIVCALGLTTVSLSSCALGQGSGEPSARLATAPSLEQVKGCLRRPEGAECLDKLFSEMLKTHSTSQALALVRQFENEDAELRRACHPVVHAIGRETFRLKENIHESFAACDQTCHSGCYHGSVERFLRGGEVYAQATKHPTQAELREKAAQACDPTLPWRLRFQCLHGLGHALLYFSRYRLIPSLEACDALAEEWSRESCYGGVFMENISGAVRESRDVNPDDYHYPCNRLDDRYRNQCYAMQTSRMAEMGLTTEELFRECVKAGAYAAQCSLSVGRDLSNRARIGEAAEVARQCELAQGARRHACIRGVVYALIDNTWDGRYALPFCSALVHARDQNLCLQESVDYLKVTFEKSEREVAEECLRYANLPRCRELAAG